MSGFSNGAAPLTASLMVTAVDAFGNSATNYRGSVSFTSTDSRAVLPANYAVLAGDAGTHTFAGVTLMTPGNQNITVTDVVNGSIQGTENNIAVATGAPSHFTVTGVQGGTAPVVGEATVTAVDKANNVVTTYLGQITFKSRDFQAQLPSGYSFAPADGGSQTFTVVLPTAGSQSIIVTDVNQPSMIGVQSNINVVAGPAVLLMFSPLTPPVAGANTPLTLRAVDANGNTATTYGGLVTLTCSDTQATLPASYSFARADAGVHVFANAVLRTAGPASLTAFDTSNGISGTLYYSTLCTPR